MRSRMATISSQMHSEWSHRIGVQLDDWLRKHLAPRGWLAVFSPTRREPSISELFPKWMSDYRLALPRMSSDKALNQMDFHHVVDLAALQPESRFGGRWLEPKADCPRVSPLDLEVICIPALAIDQKGFRLGNGGGFYDRYLGTVPESCSRIAVAFDSQMVENVPTDRHDCQMHFALTESGMRDFPR